MKNKGFTIVELMAVILILSVLVILATTSVFKHVNSAQDSSNESSLKEAENAGPLFTDRNAYFLNAVSVEQPNTYYSEDDFQAYGDLIEDLCGDIAYYTQSEIHAIYLTPVILQKYS